MKEIKKYKGVSLKYNENDGCIYFNFEGNERNTKYVFEAEKVIDEPKWKECEMYGYFVDGYIDKYIGKAIASRINIKTGIPNWKIKGQYDLEYKYPSYSNGIKTYLKNDHNDNIYELWKIQRDVYLKELRKLNDIIKFN